MPGPDRRPWWLLHLSLLAYTVALAAPTTFTPQAANWWAGGWLLFLWGAVMAPPAAVTLAGAAWQGGLNREDALTMLFLLSWSANLLLYLGWGNLFQDAHAGQRRRLTLLFCGAAVVAAASGLGNPGRDAVKFTWLSPAYWLWLGSAVLALVACLTQKETRPPDLTAVLGAAAPRWAEVRGGATPGSADAATITPAGGESRRRLHPGL